MLNNGDIIEFTKSKQFKYIKPLGDGGTGSTHLFLDETTTMNFAIKKYSPKQKEYKNEFYNRFVDEIKILFTLSHPNIVRVYNYYLYPEYKLGYIQMEYIQGIPIDQHEIFPWTKNWENIFSDIISAFRYLEYNHILHRDIRAANILIDQNDNVKIIDFGFGKVLKNEDEFGESVILNWPVSEMPEEVALNSIYNHQSEIYFLGKLFEHILRSKDKIQEFRYYHIINKMIKVNPSERYQNFAEIEQDISLGILAELDFNNNDKEIYQHIADSLSNSIINFTSTYQPITNIKDILTSLATLIRSSSLEEIIQHNNIFIKSFLHNGFRYRNNYNIKVDWIKTFYQFMNRLSPQKQKIVMDNINMRLSNIPVILEDDELPF